MGVRQRGHSGFSLHHSVIQFLHCTQAEQEKDQTVKTTAEFQDCLEYRKTIPAEYMATRSGSWVLSNTQAECTFATYNNCLGLHKK